MTSILALGAQTSASILLVGALTFASILDFSASIFPNIWGAGNPALSLTRGALTCILSEDEEEEECLLFLISILALGEQTSASILPVGALTFASILDFSASIFAYTWGICTSSLTWATLIFFFGEEDDIFPLILRPPSQESILVINLPLSY